MKFHTNTDMDSIYNTIYHIKRYAAREPNLEHLSEILDALRDIEHGIIVRLNFDK